VVVLPRAPGPGARGAPRRLTPEQREALLARGAQGRVRTDGAAQHGVAQECGVRYRYAGLYDLLRRMTVQPTVPRPTAANAAPAAQAAWTKGA
jgi:transposase